MGTLSLDVLFDVGANVGQFAREARRELPAAAIHCFEPHPRSFEKLSQLGADELTHLHRLALSDKVDEVFLYEYSTEDDGSHLNSLVPDARFPARFGYKSRPIMVSSTTIDEFCAGQSIDRIDFLSIDTEGSEYEILSHFDFDHWNLRTIAVEHNGTEARQKIFELLTHHGYRRKWPEVSLCDDWYFRA